MGILSKVMFWKGDDDFDFDKDMGSIGEPPGFNEHSMPPPEGKGMNLPSLEGYSSKPSASRPLPGMPDLSEDEQVLPKTEYTDPSMARLDQPSAQPLQQPFQSQFQQVRPPQSFSHDDIGQKNMEIISAKLDILKVTMEGLNQKLDNLMHIASKHDDDETDRYRKHNW